MSMWEDLEQHLFDNDLANSSFTAETLATDMGLPAPWMATRLIQAYLTAQSAPRSKTLFVLHRTGRTKSAVWHVGVRTSDATELGHQAGDDFRRRVERHVAPTLHRIGAKNPRARQTTEAMVNLMEATAQLLVAGGEEDGQHP